MKKTKKKTRQKPSKGVKEVKFKKPADLKPVKKEIRKDTPDLLDEQLEKPLTTRHCPQSITKDDLGKVKKNPENYIEINMINKSRMVDNFYIPITRKNFKYRDKTYSVNEKKIYLLPSKSGFFMLTSFYKEGQRQPKSFENTNKGITSKALSILYNERLYHDLFAPDETKYNFIIAVFSIVCLALYCAGLILLIKGDI